MEVMDDKKFHHIFLTPKKIKKNEELDATCYLVFWISIIVQLLVIVGVGIVLTHIAN